MKAASSSDSLFTHSKTCAESPFLSGPWCGRLRDPEVLGLGGMSSPFGNHVEVAIVRHGFGDEYTMESVDDRFLLSDSDVRTIARICNEPLVYRFLFRDRIGGRPYTGQDARDFIDWARSGWSSGQQMVFLLRDPHGEIGAAIDIGPLDESRDALIGYWASSFHRGLMTNTVERLAELSVNAGYSKLVALAEAENVRSISILKRAGFTHVGAAVHPVTFMGQPVGIDLRFRRYERAL